MRSGSLTNRRRALRAVLLGIPTATGVLSRDAVAAPKKSSFEQYVTAKLDDIDTTLGTEGVSGQLGKVSDKLDQVLAGMTACDASAGDGNDVAAVRSTLDEIKKVLHLP